MYTYVSLQKGWICIDSQQNYVTDIYCVDVLTIYYAMCQQADNMLLSFLFWVAKVQSCLLYNNVFLILPSCICQRCSSLILAEQKCYWWVKVVGLVGSSWKHWCPNEDH